MREFEIIENNKLIATFMGFTYYGSNHPLRPKKDDILSSEVDIWCGWKTHPDVLNLKWYTWHPLSHEVFLCRSHNDLKYHLKWDWLIPVCKKLNMKSISTDINITFNNVLKKLRTQ